MPALTTNPGELVRYRDQDALVVDVSPLNIATLRMLDTGDVLSVHVHTASGAGLLEYVDDANKTLADSAVERMTGIDEEQLVEAYRRQAVVNKILYGVADPSNSNLVPEGRFASDSIIERRQAALDEIQANESTMPPEKRSKVSMRTLGRWQKDYVARGVRGLVPTKQTRQRTAAEPRLVAIVDHVLADLTYGSTVPCTVLMARVEKHWIRQFPDETFPVGNRTLRRVIEDRDVRSLAKKSAKHRRTEAVRHSREQHPIRVHAPGEIVEIDSTDIDLMCLDDAGKPFRLKLVAAIDVATRSLIGFMLLPVGVKGHDLADFLARVLRPRWCEDTAPEWMRLSENSNLPFEELRSLAPTTQAVMAVPLITPESITTDLGPDYISITFRNACEHFGISVRTSPPGSATYKPHVERFMDTVKTDFSAHLAGYTGGNPDDRGKDIEKGLLLTMWEVIEAFEKWWIIKYQNTPHDGLRDAKFPARMYSPNQMYSYLFETSPCVGREITRSDYIALMPSKIRAIQNDMAFHVRNRTYRHPLLIELRQENGPVDGAWSMKVDHTDPNRVWVQHPKTRDWIECLADDHVRADGVFASNITSLRGIVPAEPIKPATWASEVNATRYAQKDLVAKTQRATDTNRPDPSGPPRPAIHSVWDDSEVDLTEFEDEEGFI